MNRFYFLLPLLCLLYSCTQKTYLKRSLSYLNASDESTKSRYMGPGFRSYFAENEKDSGKNKEQVLHSFMSWDGPMHPDIKMLHHSIHGRTCTVDFLEQNDFSKLIGFPGWKGRAVFVFTSKKYIQRYTYFPDSTNPPYKPYLEPALDWLEKNKPEELKLVYQNKKLVQNQNSAKLWVQLLKQWREQTQTLRQ
jgi:hypothetical protein